MKVLLLIDVDSWAWAHKAKAIKKFLPQYDIDIKLQSKFIKADLQNYDSVHFFSWMDINNPSKVTAGISSHNYHLIHAEKAKQQIPKLGGVSCVSKILFDRLTVEGLNKNLYLCMNGVDESVFYPKKRPENNKFTVGWVSQKTKGNLDRAPFDIKGYEHILLPLKNKLESHGDIHLIIHDNNYTNAINQDQMCDLYNKFDLLISTSLAEGTPNSAFEASACGVPILSTNVGCIPELIQDEFNGYKISPYNKNTVNETIKEFYDKILFCNKNKELVNEMSRNARNVIEMNWTWKYRSTQWIPLFENHKTR